MAVTLPTITIQDNAIAQKVFDAFSGVVDPATGNPITPQQAYRQWLRAQLVEYVSQIRAQQRADARKAQDDADLASEKQALLNATA